MTSRCATILTILGIMLGLVCVCFGTDNRIVGGRPAEEGEFPYQVSLRRSYNDKHFCGGSLIQPNYVLTAAHCMFYQWGGPLPPIVVSVVAGQLNLTMTPNSIHRNVTEIRVHPDYNHTSMANDVALIKVDQAFPINHLIATIPLASKDQFYVNCIVSGWGVQEFESKNVSETLLTTVVKRISNEQCDQMYGGGVIVPSMICAYDAEGEHDACQGDSGGPMVTHGQLIGVISTGEGCASKQFPGIYASVPYLHSWIMETLTAMNLSKTVTETTLDYEETETTLNSEDQTSQSTITTKLPKEPQNQTTSNILKTTNVKNEQQNTIVTKINQTKTTPKNINNKEDIKVTLSIDNQTKPPIHIGDQSRMPDDSDDDNNSGLVLNGKFLLVTMLLLISLNFNVQFYL